jgi:hypothetical protein
MAGKVDMIKSTKFAGPETGNIYQSKAEPALRS